MIFLQLALSVFSKYLLTFSLKGKKLSSNVQFFKYQGLLGVKATADSFKDASKKKDECKLNPEPIIKDKNKSPHASVNMSSA